MSDSGIDNSDEMSKAKSRSQINDGSISIPDINEIDDIADIADIDDIDIDIDVDEVLNVEDKYYQEGVAAGLAQASVDQYRDGLQYGYQTGFQRFLVVGYARGLWEWWSHEYNDNDRIVGHLRQLESYLDGISTTNEEAAVEKYEKAVTKIRNKIRVIATVLKQPALSRAIDEVIAIGGTVQLNENPDDMW